jgi:hypothetical protein
MSDLEAIFVSDRPTRTDGQQLHYWARTSAGYAVVQAWTNSATSITQKKFQAIIVGRVLWLGLKLD